MIYGIKCIIVIIRRLVRFPYVFVYYLVYGLGMNYNEGRIYEFQNSVSVFFTLDVVHRLTPTSITFSRRLKKHFIYCKDMDHTLLHFCLHCFPHKSRQEPNHNILKLKVTIRELLCDPEISVHTKFFKFPFDTKLVPFL